MKNAGRLDLGNTLRTQSLYEASFLLTKGYCLKGKEKIGDKYFITLGGNEGIKEEALRFYNGAKVEAKLLFDNYRSLKDYIFER